MSEAGLSDTVALPPTEPPGAMGALWDRVVAVAQSLGDEDWQRPVPWCPDWDVADLVSHLGGLQSALNGAPQPDPPAGFQAPVDADIFTTAMAPAIAARVDWPPLQRLEELQTAADAHVALLAAVEDWNEATVGPTGPTTQLGLYVARCFDVWVHLQDLNEALERPVDSDDRSPGATAAALFVLNVVPWMYAKRVGAPEGSTMRLQVGPPVDHDRVVQITNGRAAWHDDVDAGDCVVTATPAALTLLLAGRGSPQRWRDAGVLSWAGSRGSDFVELAGMF